MDEAAKTPVLSKNDSNKRQLSPDGDSPEAKKYFFEGSPDLKGTHTVKFISAVNMPHDEASTSEWFKALFAKIDEMWEMHERSNTALEFCVKDLAECKSEVKSLTLEVNELKKVISDLEYDKNELQLSCKQLHNDTLKMEIHRRECNVIIEGIQETHGEDHSLLYNKIVKTMNHMEVFDNKAAQAVVVRCQRLGPFSKGYNRPVMCQFLRYSDAFLLLKNRKQLPSKVYASEDYPPEIEERRKVLRPIFNKAKRMDAYKGKCRLVADKLIIKGKAFTLQPVNNLADLPDELCPRKAAEKENEEILAFFSQGSPFSNFHPSPFEKDGVKYVCNEQYIQAKKAEIFDDDNAHANIMKTTNPYEMKKIGKRVRNFVFQLWQKEAEVVATSGCMAKFSQNPELCKMLLYTGNKTLAEASTDSTWGTGEPLNSPGALQKSSWTGGNLLGKVLMAVREELKSG